MAPNRDRPPPQSSCASSALGNQTDEDEPNPNGKGNHGTPNSTQPSGATQTLTNQEELARARRTAQNALPHGYTTLDSDNKDQSNEETLGPEDENKSNFLSKGGIDRASKEESDDGYKASSCKRTLEKFCAISKELKYSPNSKAEFVRICRTKECPTPHNIQRDVQT
ncbi:hypothetical protein H4Q26_000952 [Puccinia striiformis f. sp. tritici PST-130]|nr:hypothetical protein H4Q26_000952 [Puccinia striiformis f. sp. tritici PST-130]